MIDTHLLHHLPARSAARQPEAPAMRGLGAELGYAEFFRQIEAFCSGLIGLGLPRAGRVAVYLDKRFETVVACFGTACAGGAFVPVNPVLKPAQVAYILRDCNVRVMVTSRVRLASLRGELAACPDLTHVVLIDTGEVEPIAADALALHRWSELLDAPARGGHRVIDTDMTAILYTSGSTGRPKGVVLSHRNMVAGAKSVASYLENRADDRIVAALPLSFDAGFSQLTTAFHVGASVSLLNYLLPRDVIDTIQKDKITGLTAVPPLYVQLAQLDWPAGVTDHLRYFANTGGRMPAVTLGELRKRLPRTKPFLMYGLTEAFRSTYLPPDQIDRRPDSIGKAIPNAEILVLREDGTQCGPGEPGELVHRGALVGMGYWNDAEKTAERYKPLPGREAGLMIPEIAVFSGDTVRADDEGYLYFIGRRDEMMKTSGYRVSPSEVEEMVYSTQRVGECAAFGVPHPALGQAIVLVVTDGAHEPVDTVALVADLKDRMPTYMLPARIEVRPAPLPRNANGKIDRKLLSVDFQRMFDREDA